MNPFIRVIPPLLVRTFARPYVAGDSLERAMEVVNQLREQRLCASLDLLAEDIHTEQQARENEEVYRRMIERVSDPALGSRLDRPTVSLKLSSYTTAPLEDGGDGAGCRDAATRLVELARERDVRLTIDMESRHWTDFTLSFLNDLHQQGHRHVGGVLQTRLHRTANDLETLPDELRVRLVIGIYNEPDDVATTDKREMKERMLTGARRLLERGHYVELATHDEVYLRRFIDEVVTPMGVDTDRYEVQMLYGVPRAALQRELLDRGVRVRIYVPFAMGWPMAIAYLRRRLDEYPRMMLLVAKNLLVRT